MKRKHAAHWAVVSTVAVALALAIGLVAGWFAHVRAEKQNLRAWMVILSEHKIGSGHPTYLGTAYLMFKNTGAERMELQLPPWDYYYTDRFGGGNSEAGRTPWKACLTWHSTLGRHTRWPFR